MSFWNDPRSSFQGLFDDPWRSMQNFGTTGLVPLIPAVAGVVGGIYGGPAGAVAAGSAAQGGVDYFGGNSDARTGKGIGKSLAIGGGKGYLGYLGADYFGGGAGDVGDVWSGWSPSGSSAGGNLSTLSPSSSNPADYTDPYAAQDVMQQARDTSVASGEAGAWDNPAVSSGAKGGMFNKQMLARSLMNMGGGKGQMQQQPPLEIIKSQPAFLQQTQAIPIQDSGYTNNNPYILFGDEEKKKLAQALRNS